MKPVTLIDARLEDRRPVEAHAKGELIRALERRGAAVESRPFYRHLGPSAPLLIGRRDDPWMRRALRLAGLDVVPRAEGVFFGAFHNEEGRRVNLAGGTDSRGLAYALLELADRVDDAGPAALEQLDPAVATPHNRVRGVTRFVVNHHDERWMFDEAFLRRWYARLLRSRFNRVEYVLGFDTAYLSPPYPWFVGVEGFEHLRVRGLSDQQRARNLEGLRRMGQLAHDYGLDFSLAPWQQKAWTRDQAALVAGLPQEDDALIAYTERAVTALLDACPEIDVFQLRVNLEAGVAAEDGVATNEAYWHRILDAVAGSDRAVELELRAKGLTDGMIHAAQSRGLAVTVPTKYWCEHFPVPYHISRLRDEELEALDDLNHSRRYSYADMLRKPRTFDLLYRLWNYGTTNVLEWGDPETARRFSRTCRFGGAKGFVITAPLSLKGGMEALDCEPQPFIADPDDRVGPDEDARYALWYLCFGRMGYNPACGAEVWRRALRTRYGADLAPALERALTAGGKILPLVTTAHMPVHPSLIYWTEMSTGGALFPQHNYNRNYGDVGYIEAKASDEGLFYAIADFADDRLSDRVRGRYTPLQVARWLASLADQVARALIALPEDTAAVEPALTRMTVTDLRMLAALARYHAEKTRAAVHLALWQRTGGGSHLAPCRSHMTAAREHWRVLSDLGGVYVDDLCSQMNATAMNARRGHWRDRLVEMDRDLERIDALMEEVPAECPPEPLPAPLPSGTPGLNTVILHVPETWPAGETMPVRLEVPDPFAGKVALHYRRTNLLEGDFRQREMTREGNSYRAEIPGAYLTPEWDLLVYASTPLSRDEVQIVPGLWHPASQMPYRVVRIG